MNSKGKRTIGHWNENVKSQKWIHLRQTKTKMISDIFYTCRLIYFDSENASFCDIFLKLFWKASCRSGRMTAHLYICFICITICIPNLQQSNGTFCNVAFEIYTVGHENCTLVGFAMLRSNMSFLANR